jgi:chemotaxis protein MotB
MRTAALTGIVALHVAVALAMSNAGCIVPKRDYDQVVQAAANDKAAAAARDRDQTARIQELQQRLTAAESGTQDRDAKIGDLSTAVHNVQTQLDEATAINQELRTALERMGKDADKLLAERGTLSKALDDAKVRLEELRRAQAAAEARVATFRDFSQRFKALVDAGQLRVESRHGAMVLDVSSDLLFEPGRSELRAAGKGVLMEVAHAIATLPGPAVGRRFLVTAHVDDEAPPAKGGKHARSPWALTAERGAAVVDYLVSMGVAPESLEAGGAASFDPLAPNDSTDARARNRRVEIALLPPDAPASGPAPVTPVAPGSATPPQPAPAPPPQAAAPTRSK